MGLTRTSAPIAPCSGKLDHAFTAHPKIDPDTREMFYFGYSTERAPHCALGEGGCRAAVVVHAHKHHELQQHAPG